MVVKVLLEVVILWYLLMTVNFFLFFTFFFAFFCTKIHWPHKTLNQIESVLNQETSVISRRVQRISSKNKLQSTLNIMRISSDLTIEELPTTHQFDQIISRAFTHLNGMIECSLAFLKPGGEILAMKGAQAESEIVTAQSTHGNCIIRLYKLPHIVDEQRMLVVVKQRSE